MFKCIYEHLHVYIQLINIQNKIIEGLRLEKAECRHFDRKNAKWKH